MPRRRLKNDEGQDVGYVYDPETMRQAELIAKESLQQLHSTDGDPQWKRDHLANIAAYIHELEQLEVAKITAYTEELGE